MWEFMYQYADSFWEVGAYAYEVFTVIMAWAITIGIALFVITIIWAIGEMIADGMRKKL